MVFSSITFLVYFLPAVLLLYYCCPRPARNILLLIASVVFYSWGAPRFIFMILGTTLLDFFLVRAMDESQGASRRRAFLVLSLCLNLGLLFYFKYCDFFVGNFNVLLQAIGIGPVPLLHVVLPIGISFYTFESLTYVIDVYRRVHPRLKNFWNYQLYIIFFPKLIAGPIVRYHEIADQITDRQAFDNIDNKIFGFFKFAVGLAKKVFIANTMAIYADGLFDVEDEFVTTPMAWIGALCYTFQIYFDFSGYSDMAIGLARLFGFRLPENFNNPYTSQSITEFWRRWHITLGNWMRNYLYIPLGGNRVASRNRIYFNLWLVFLASGLWHGAAWTFVLWGAYHGAFLVMERIFLLKLYHKAGRLIATSFTFLVVMHGWVLFKASSIYQARDVYAKMYAFDFAGLPGAVDRPLIVVLAISCLFSFFTIPAIGQRIHDRVFEPTDRLWRLVGYGLVGCVLVLMGIASVTASSFNPFIYFRF